jgi:hypothetical protein
MITAEEVIRRIETYFHGGTARFLTPAEREIATRAVAGHAETTAVGNGKASARVSIDTRAPYAIRHGKTVRVWSDSVGQRDRLFAARPKIGLVVGTFAAVPYVHLQLEARRRLYPDIPMLLHDDCSPHGGELEKLCTAYSVECASTLARFPMHKGDLSAMAGGLAWARGQSLDILVKMSRRFLPLKPWADDLATLAMTSQYATYSSWTTSYNFGFRTECIGFAVEEWFTLGLFDQIIDAIRAPEAPFVEGFIHGLARHAAARNTQAARTFDEAVGRRPRNRGGYAIWPFMGTDRRAPTSNFLWHNWATPEDYAAQARQWDLPYQAADFCDPDMASDNITLIENVLVPG